MAKPLIQLNQISKSFGGRRVLDRLDWQLEQGECAVILGPSGGGKTVFLHILLGLLAPDDGEVTWPGVGTADFFKSAAVLFQEDALLEEWSVEANLAVALRERAELYRPPFDARTAEAISAALREVRLEPERMRGMLPSALSGGMRRRVALARALIRQPRILIADEPTTGLDPASAARVYDLLGELIRRRGMSAILITHDPACASRLGYPVYYFSPVQGLMPRWNAPPTDTSPAERHRDLLLWMHGQTVDHTRRQEEKGPEKPDEAARPARPLAERVRDRFTGFLDGLGRGGILLGELAGRPSLGLLAVNLWAWGAKSAPLMGLIFLMLGIVTEVQSEAAVVGYGLSNRLPELIALSLLRLAPILMGFLLAGRCGSAISAQVGWMQLAGQFRALRTMRIEPDRALFPPIFWSMVIAAPLLALAGLLIGAAGAAAMLASPVSQAKISLTFFLKAYPTFLSVGELAVVALKSALMGGGIAAIAYAGGARPKRSPADVTSAITGGLVAAFLWVALVDMVLSLATAG